MGVKHGLCLHILSLRVVADDSAPQGDLSLQSSKSIAYMKRKWS